MVFDYQKVEAHSFEGLSFRVSLEARSAATVNLTTGLSVKVPLVMAGWLLAMVNLSTEHSVVSEDLSLVASRNLSTRPVKQISKNSIYKVSFDSLVIRPGQFN